MARELESSKSRGFSLIEVLVALCVIGIMLVPLFAFIANRLRREQETEFLQLAIDVGRAAMGQVLLQDRPEDDEETIDGRFLVCTKVYDGDKSDEPQGMQPLEIQITVYSLHDSMKMAEFHALR